MDLHGKKCLITGASGGIGAATAKKAAGQGAAVILVARSQGKLNYLAGEIRDDNHTASVYPTDLSDLAAINDAARRIRDTEGPPDIIINNAGAGQWKYARETAPEEAAGMMAVPYLAAFALTRAFLPEFIERKSGMIVNITSAAAFMTWPGAAAYTAARWAIRGFTEALATELTPHRISVMLVAFAKVSSDYWLHNPGSEQHIPGRQSMIPELTPNEAADHIVKGIRRNTKYVIEPWQRRAVITAAKFFPGMVK